MNKYITKVFRKLKLGDTLYPCLGVFCGMDKPAMTTAEAVRLLNDIQPDDGESCIRKDVPETGTCDADVDIIIPCYNSEKYLHECIRSVLDQQTQYRWRIIAIDDGSADSTADILDSYAEDNKIVVVHQENRGFSGARNAGLRYVQAKYIYFLDSDDVLLPGAIEALVSCAEETTADLVEGAFSVLDLSGKTVSEEKHKDGQIMPDGDWLGFPCGKLFKRHVFEKIEFPVGYWYEDSIIAHIVFPMLEANKGIAWGTSAMTFGYRSNPEGISRSGRTSPKSIDALWVHLHLYEDRKQLGLRDTQSYYDYILKMLVLTYHRTENQSETAKQAIFVVWKDFLARNFSDFNSNNKSLKELEKAVRAGDYGRYCLFCALH